MTKKKIIKFVVLGFALFLLASTLGVFMVCVEIEAGEFRENFYLVYDNFNEFAWNYEADEHKKAIAEKSGISDVNVFMQKYLEGEGRIGIDYPMVVSAVDEDGNWYEAFRNYITVNLEKEQVYINLDEYLSEEQKEEVREMTGVSQIKLGHNGEKYVLYEITFTDYIKNKVTYTYSSETPVVVNDMGTLMYIQDIRLEKYDKKLFKNLYETIEKDHGYNHNFDSSGGGASVSSEEANGHHSVEIAGKKYIIYYAMEYNLPMRAIKSHDFKYFTFMFTFFLGVAAIIFLCLCFKLNKKSELIENSKRTFISAAAHELKTPLAVIQNQCECIMENVAPEKNGEYLESIYDEALRMNDIVSTLLTFNRISATNKIIKEKCNLTEILLTQTDKYLSFAQSKGAEMVVQANETVVTECNAELMALAIDNYLSNAVKYATGEKLIKVSLFKTKEGFCLEVFNTSEPIDENKVNVLWNVLEREDASRMRDGNSTGMGLPICKRIFDLHGYYGEYKTRDNGVVFSVKGK